VLIKSRGLSGLCGFVYIRDTSHPVFRSLSRPGGEATPLVEFSSDGDVGV